MTSPKPVNLRIVSSERIHPHETADPGREQRIERRLRQDTVLRDPLLVGKVADVDGYILLDGTNRLGALRNLGLPLVLAQIVDYADPHAIELRTWCHRPPIKMDEFLALIADVAGMRMVEIAPLGTVDALREPETIAVALEGRRRIALSGAFDRQSSRITYLRELIELYEDRLIRVDCDVECLEEQAHSLSSDASGSGTLIAFPPFSRSQVVSLALSGTRIPAGITRHIIHSGRALRVNVPLELLSGDEKQAGRALERHLGALQPRIYVEPTVLFDS